MNKIWPSDFFLFFLRLSLYMCVLCCCSSKLTLNNDKILQFRIYVYTILSTYGYVQYVSDQNGYHTHKRTNCNIMYQHSDVTRLRCTLFNKKNLFWKPDSNLGSQGCNHEKVINITPWIWNQAPLHHRQVFWHWTIQAVTECTHKAVHVKIPELGKKLLN